jgi:hypothetical protein
VHRYGLYRLKKAEEKCRALEMDKDAILASNAAVSVQSYTILLSSC